MKTDPPKVNHVDPINGKTMLVRSVYIPKNTLLKGATYSRSPRCLGDGKWITTPVHTSSGS
jgi:hypothetical protein